MSKGLSKIASLISKMNVCLLCINQLRENVGVLFGSKKTIPGGQALKFYASIMMEVTKTGLVPDKNDPTGIHVKVKCVKNKVAPPFKEAEFNIMFSKPGIDKFDDLLKYGKSIGLFGKSKGWYTIKGNKMREAEAKLTFSKNPDIYEEYYDKAWNGELDDPEEDDNNDDSQ